jgi:hypothetical protein
MREPDLAGWTTRPRPSAEVLEGRWCRLEMLDPIRHGDSLYDASVASGAEERYRYLFESPPAARGAFDTWAQRAASGDDPLFYAVIDPATGRAEGRQALMRITPEHGVIEIGSILWGPRLARTREPRKPSTSSPRTPLRRSVIAASNGSATPATSPPGAQRSASASRSRESFASTWW